MNDKFKNLLFTGYDSPKNCLYTVIDKNGTVKEQIVPPKYKMPFKLDIAEYNDDSKVAFELLEFDFNDQESKFYEIEQIYIHVPLPEQKLADLSSRLFYKKSGYLNLVNKIEICFQNATKVYGAREYLYSLKERMNYYFEPNVSILDKEDYEYVGQTLVPATTFHLPIIFENPLKLWMFESNCPLKIVIHFNDISSLFDSNELHSWTNLKVKDITATANYESVNDLRLYSNYFNMEQSSIETEQVLQYDQSIEVSSSDINGIDGPNAEVKQLMLLFENTSFSNNTIHYGNTVESAKRNFLNSCLKLHDKVLMNKDSPIFFLDSCLFLNETSTCQSYKIQKISDFKVSIQFDKWKTILSSNTSFKSMNSIVFDLNTSSLLKLYWFKEAFLRVDEFDVQIVDSTKSINNAKKLAKGLFVNDSLAYIGFESFKMRQNVPDDILTKYTCGKETILLNDKIYAFMFSMPVFPIKVVPSYYCVPSYFAQFDFVYLRRDLFNNFIDLDGNFCWQVERILIYDKMNRSYFKILDKDMLSVSCTDLKFFNQVKENKIQIVSWINENYGSCNDKLSLGYFNLKDYKFDFKIEEAYFMFLLRDFGYTIKLNMSFFILQSWQYSRGRYIFLDDRKINENLENVYNILESSGLLKR
jgi:hypothetical protein